MRKYETYSVNFLMAALFAAAAWYFIQPGASFKLIAQFIIALSFAGGIYDLLSVKYNLKIIGWSRELEALEKKYISDLRKKRIKSGLSKLAGAAFAYITAGSLPAENPIGEQAVYLILLVYAVTIVIYNNDLNNRISILKDKIGVSAERQ